MKLARLRLIWPMAVAALMSAAWPAIAQVPVAWTDVTGDHHWENALNWTPPVVPNGTQYDVQISPLQTVSCDLSSAVTVDSVSITPGKMLRVFQGSLTIDGAAPALKNNGAIQLVSFASPETVLRFNRSTVLSGSGAIHLFGDEPHLPKITAESSTEAVTITNDTGHRIHGAGQIDLHLVNFKNNGTITADDIRPLRLLVDGGNTGIIEGNGGELRLESAILDQTGGGIIQAVLAGNGLGTVQLGNPGFVTIKAGTIRGVSGGRVLVNSATLDNCTLEGLVHVLPKLGTSLVIGPGVLTNNGTLVINPDGAGQAQVTFSGNVQLAGAGNIQLNGSGVFDAFLQTIGTTVTNTASHVLRGRGTLAIGLINNGLVSADVTGGTLRASTSCQNNGVMEAKNGGVLELTGVGFANQSRAGVLRAQGVGSIIRIGFQSTTPGPELFAADLQSGGGGKVQLARVTLRDSRNSAVVEAVAPGPVTVKGQLTNDGSINPQGGALVLTHQSSLAGSGAVGLDRGAVVVDAQDGGVVAATNASGHTISGKGQINALGSGATFINNGTIAPGGTAKAPVGEIATVGNIVLGNSSRLAFDIAGNSQGISYDVFRKNDAIPLPLNGQLRVAVTNGFTPAASDAFIVVTGTTLTGSFSNAPNGGRITTDDGTGSFLVTYNAADVVLSDYRSTGVTPTPTPTPSPTPATSPPPRPLNISTRMQVGTGDRVLIGGFIISGSQFKTVLLRGLGPSLGNVGVADSLQDPVLELHDASGATIALNNNWKDTQEAAITATGIPPGDDRESAILQSLAPGFYTVVERGAGDTLGVGLVEIYDVGGEPNARLANISTRGFVETGSKVMIGGFILGGGNTQGPATVLVRALGPSLGAAGVPDALSDPILELHDPNGATIARNDNWKDTQQTEIESTTIPPPDDFESAIFATLPGGSYTAIVVGKNNPTGVGLVEIYNLQ